MERGFHVLQVRLVEHSGLGRRGGGYIPAGLNQASWFEITVEVAPHTEMVLSDDIEIVVSRRKEPTDLETATGAAGVGHHRHVPHSVGRLLHSHTSRYCMAILIFVARGRFLRIPPEIVLRSISDRISFLRCSVAASNASL